MVRVDGKGNSDSLIKIRGLDKQYKRGGENIDVLQGLNLDVDRGDITVVFRQHRYRLRPFNERCRVGLERRGRVGLGKGAVERVGAGAIAAQHRLLDAVGIDQHASLGVTLAVAFRDNRRDGLVREIRGDAVRREQALGVGLGHEKSSA